MQNVEVEKGNSKKKKLPFRQAEKSFDRGSAAGTNCAISFTGQAITNCPTDFSEYMCNFSFRVWALKIIPELLIMVQDREIRAKNKVRISSLPFLYRFSFPAGRSAAQVREAG